MSEPRSNRTNIKIGDRFSVPVEKHRKWWEFWKPRRWTERHEYVVTGDFTSHGHQLLDAALGKGGE